MPFRQSKLSEYCPGSNANLNVNWPESLDSETNMVSFYQYIWSLCIKSYLIFIKPKSRVNVDDKCIT